MIGIYTFNENTAANVYDYSGNGNDATSISNFSIVAGELGYAGSFNGTTTDLNFGNIANLTGTLSIFCKLKVTTGAAQIICDKSNHFTLGINASDKITFTIASGGSTWTITSSTSIANDTWTTIGAVYDGSDMYIYLDGVEDVTNAQTGSFTASSSDFHIGTDTSTYLNGRIEMIELNTAAYNEKNILAVHNNPTGLKMEFYNDHGFELGDLIETLPYNAALNKKAIVTYKDSATILRIKLNQDRINIGDKPVRRGNIYDIDRQWIMEARIDNDEPIIKISDKISKFAETTSETSEAIRINRLEASRDGRDFLRYALML